MNFIPFSYAVWVSVANSASTPITVTLTLTTPILDSVGVMGTAAAGTVSGNGFGATLSYGLPSGTGATGWGLFPESTTSFSGTVTTSQALDEDVLVVVLADDGNPLPVGSIPAGSLSGNVNWSSTGTPAKKFTRGKLLEEARRQHRAFAARL